jgi:arylsulfatase A-like enzyme
LKLNRACGAAGALGVTILVVASGAPPFEHESAVASHRRRPNILIIVTDDQRASGTMTVMPKTRRLFGRGGTRFTNAYATTPLCCPSRASIFTGQYVHNHGVTNNESGDQIPQRRTFQRYLDRAGYRTAISGKYLNGFGGGKPPHFDRFAVLRGGFRDARFNVEGTFRTVGYSTRFIARKAVDYMRAFDRDDSAPWLLYVAPNAPHVPSVPEAKYSRASVPRWRRNPAVRERDRSDKPPYVLRRSADLDHVREHRRDQLRTLMSVDDLVQRILREVSALDERRRTLAVFTSDNGYLWGEHGLVRKRAPYIQSVKIPLFARWPGHVARGVARGRPVTNVDIGATVFDAAGIRPSHALDGTSLLASRSRGRILLEYFRDRDMRDIPPWASTLTSRFQYTEFYDRNRNVTFKEYYRLRRDPWQLRNVLRDGEPANNPSSARLRRLHRTLRRDRNCTGSACP